ncbi:MAG: right-handed parallel beta-helix repeat-containing protein [Planctomycetes bacterium]|nr:right-handed parallel beta-helix repeat-containing protein [Planctomycetota bacterium]
MITVRSANGPDNCIIDCQGSEADPQRGFYFDSGETADAVVDGFTITNGFVTAAAPGGPNGGGLFLLNSSPTVTNCVVSGNTAFDEFGHGGGMFIDLGSPVISDCTFTGNMAEFRGGGIYLRDGSMTVTNCTFQGNSTPVIGQHGGGAIFSRDSLVNLVDCDLHENEGYHGGAIAFVQFSGEGASLTLIGCSVTNNSAVAGGGVLNHNSTSLLINSILASNQVNGEFGIGGGIVLLSNSSALLVSTTIVANSASEGGGVWMGASSAQVRNGILWDNIPDQISGSAVVRYSDVQGGWSAGSNNIDVDPLFVDPDNGDYRLSSGSECIDAARNSYLPKGIDTDLDGNPRFIDDPKTKNTGSGDCPIVDMGSYEFQEGTTDCCPWDLDEDDNVGTSDLLELFAQWGTAGSADFDGSGAVNTADLLILFANWGLCP